MEKKELTIKQEKYVQALIRGLSQRQAYMEAYPGSKKWKEKSVDIAASNLLKNDKVSIRYQELQKKAEDEAIMTSIERKKWLSEIVKTGEISTAGTRIPVNSSDRLKAMDILNKMDSEYTEKHEVKIEESDWFK